MLKINTNRTVLCRISLLVTISYSYSLVSAISLLRLTTLPPSVIIHRLTMGMQYHIYNICQTGKSGNIFYIEG